MANKKTKLYTGNSRWTNSSRGHAIHLDKNGRPACGKLYSNGCLDRWDGNPIEITCQKCRRIYEEVIA